MKQIRTWKIIEHIGTLDELATMVRRSGNQSRYNFQFTEEDLEVVSKDDWLVEYAKRHPFEEVREIAFDLTEIVPGTYRLTRIVEQIIKPDLTRDINTLELHKLHNEFCGCAAYKIMRASGAGSIIGPVNIKVVEFDVEDC